MNKTDEILRDHFCPNRIKISQFGLKFIRSLPQEIEDTQNQDDNQKQNSASTKKQYKKRGEGINFQQFANSTMKLMNKSMKGFNYQKQTSEEQSQLQRKILFNHQKWRTQQNDIKYKVAQKYIRLQNLKYSEYDWKNTGFSLKKQKTNILKDWEKIQKSKVKPYQVKLRNLFMKRYPDRENILKNMSYSIKEHKK